MTEIKGPLYQCFVCHHVGPLYDVRMYNDLQSCPSCFSFLKDKLKNETGKDIDTVIPKNGKGKH